MKCLLTLVAVILTTALFATQGASNANAQFLYVSNNGNDANPCDTPATACRSIDLDVVFPFASGNLARYFGHAEKDKERSLD